MSDIRSYNESIRNHLTSIAKLDVALGPIELIDGWYNELYLPCQINKSLSDENEWISCFTQTELDALAKFHLVFNEVVELLSDDPYMFSDDSNWKKLQLAAISALQEMGAHSNA